MIEKILFVDDEQNILEGYLRALRKDFEVDTANSGAEGLEKLSSQGPYAVVVSDMRMPEMSGVEFLSSVREVSPKSVRIMLTGNADQETAIEAINEGAIFRFLTKPCQPDKLISVLTAAVDQHRLIIAEVDVLERTLRGTVQLLTEILSIVNPTAFGRATRVRKLVTQITEALNAENAWQIEIAALLSQIGCIGIPQETLQKVYHGHTLSPRELKQMQAHPQMGHDLIHRIPRLEPVAEMIAYQEKLFIGAGIPADNRRGTDIPLGARILKLALDFDKLLERQFTSTEALKEIQSRESWYDPMIIQALKTAVSSEAIYYEVRFARVHEIVPNMILADSVTSVKGLMLIPKGQEVTQSICMRLRNFYEGGAITEPIKVLVPVKKSPDPSSS